MWITAGTLLLLLLAAKIAVVEHHHQFGLDELNPEARKFENYSPTESKKRLGLIFDRIDEDNNGLVTPEELKNWINYISIEYIEKEVTRLWRQLNPNNYTGISWNQFENAIYGRLLEFGKNLGSLINRDRRRWAMTNNNLDDSLTREEFSAFLNFVNHPKMNDVILMQMFDELDLDNNGKISWKEYIVDLYRPSEPDEEEPDWVSSERHVFAKSLDHDGNGYLNQVEARQWLAPQGFDNTEKEARYLFFEADVNRDEQLTKAEVLDKYDIFVGSPATEYGEALALDEL